MNLTLIIVIVIVVVLVSISSYIQIKDYFSQSDELIQELKRDLSKVHPAISKVKIYKGDKSYTINKKHVYLCMTDNDGNYYDKNSLIYVLLHEMAHVITPEIGHTELFDKNFKMLIGRAESQGLYNSNIPLVKNYCNYGN